MKAYFTIELEDGTIYKINLPVSKEQIAKEAIKKSEKAKKFRSSKFFNRAILGVLYSIRREKGNSYMPTIAEIKRILRVTEEEEKAFVDSLKWLQSQGRIFIGETQGTRYIILVSKDKKKKKQEQMQAEEKSIRRFKDVVK